MKFLYTYRTPNNKQHRGEISAPTKEAAYAALRAQGIRAGRLEEAPGFFNKLFGKGKRWITIGVLGVGCLVLGLVVLFAPSDGSALAAPERRQVVGDMGIIQKNIRNGWSEVFEHEGERFLASFAIPGVPAGQRNTTEEELKDALAREIHASASDTIEARQIKAMVEGMKQELREYLADGGTIKEYGQALVARQEEELRIYNNAKTAVEAAERSGMASDELEALWETHNAKLRRMGIKLIPMPE